MKEKQTPYILLAKYFSNACTLSEKEKVICWREETPENELLFLKLKEQWENIHQDTFVNVIPDKAIVWEKIQTSIQCTIKQVPLYTRSFLIRVSSIAAMIAVVAGAALGILFFQAEEDVTNNCYVVLAPSGQKSQLILPDGTLVWLNSDSRLTYGSMYNTSGRIVTLEGEAFFDVKQNNQYPFIVKAGTVDVKVHGTAFNVNAYAEESDISISLLRGSVSVLSSTDQRLLTYLHPNQTASVSKSDMACRIDSCDVETESIWHLNKLKFEGVQATEMWKKLERWYGVRIALQDVSRASAYWFTVKTESLTELLDIINKLTPIEYKLDGEEVTVRYK